MPIHDGDVAPERRPELGKNCEQDAVGESGKGSVAPMSVQLEGACNFRDVGGILTNDGRRVRMGKVFRSNRLSQLTERDKAILGTLGIVAVYDLRGRGERQQDPTTWAPPGLTTHVFRSGHKRRLIDMAVDYPPTRDGSLALMRDFYRGMPEIMGHIFAKLVRRIAAGGVPCVVHCSAGKDRTGAAVAILLVALGVPRAAIVADYVQTASIPGLEEDMARALIRVGDEDRLSRYPDDAIAATMAAPAEYIEHLLDGIQDRSGSSQAYLEGFGIDEEVAERLRLELLE